MQDLEDCYYYQTNKKKRNSSFLTHAGKLLINLICWKMGLYSCMHVLYVQKSASCRFEKKTGMICQKFGQVWHTTVHQANTFLVQNRVWTLTPFLPSLHFTATSNFRARHQTHSWIHVLCGQHFLGSQDKILLYFPHNRSGCLDHNVGFRSTYLGQMEFNISRKKYPLWGRN